MGTEETSQVVEMSHNTVGHEASMDMLMEGAMMRGMVQPPTYDYYQEYEYYQQKLKSNNNNQNNNRKRRIISFEESKAYIVDLDQVKTI
jgi:hypothetical protein